jgi:hypothetical protein
MKPQLTVEQLFEQIEQAWRDACGGRAMPRRADISPAKLKSCLPYVTLIDVVEGDPIDFRYRLLGQKLIDGFRSNITGGLHTQHADRTSSIWPFYDGYCRGKRRASSINLAIAVRRWCGCRRARGRCRMTARL